MTESGVKIILSNKPEKIQHESKFKLPQLPDFLRIFRILSKVLPFYITLFYLKSFLSNDKSKIYYYEKEEFISDPYEPEELYDDKHYVILFYFLITHILTIIYYFSIIAVHFHDAKPQTGLHVLWLDVHFHRFVFYISALFFKMTPRFSYLSNTLIFFYESIRIFDSDVIRRTRSLYLILHQYCQNVLSSKYYQRFRAIIEGLWLPYIIFMTIYSFDLNYVLFLYFYCFFVLMYQIQCDEFHHWIWLQIDGFCTKMVFQLTNPTRQILLKLLFTIRNLGSIEKKIYPPIDNTE